MTDLGHEARLKGDFRLFMTLIWRHLRLPDPTALQYDIGGFLQHGPRRRVIEGFRGVGKSWITAAYVLWRLYCDPQLKIVVVSASKTRADNFNTFCQQLINEVEWLSHLRSREDQRQSKLMFDVGPATPHQQPSVMAYGITSQVTGARAHEIVADDIEVPNNALTQGMRDKLWESVKEFDAILLPGGVVTYLGTPQIIMSLYNELPNRGYTVRIWPARVPNEEEREAYGGKLAPMVEAMCDDPANIGRSTEPTRFSDIDLAEREASYGRSGFRLQFMLDTALSDANRFPLKLHDLIVMSVNPERAPTTLTWAREPDLIHDDLPLVGLPGDACYRPMHRSDTVAEYTGSVMYIDPAGRGKDETGFAIVKMLNGNLFVPKGAVGGRQGGYDAETLLFLANLAKTHRVNFIRIEDNFGDGMFSELLKPVLRSVDYPCTIEGDRAVGQKEMRIIDTLEPVMNQHRLVMDPECFRNDYEDTNLTSGLERARDYMLFYQMTHITRERGALRHDDRIEALAEAVHYWVEQMAQDQYEKEDEIKTERLDQELERFIENALGKSAGSGYDDVWMDM